ncbi:hypothetical protein PDESU_03311 [Pontiella desulfatans]|uniref:Uncharacterized protein n=1 Tax=Pontiella desulfatans TaxID=2750659 RepID=A0A6C2U3Z0_PONDE|nr:hypothetical protein [Pontiella desulfatans]VGO14742.1 hypothetical protein PDESU_03311 [Pontiella desulfatans]
MELEKQIESAIAAVLGSIDGLNVRAYLVDDTPGETVPEPLAYPYCACAASPVGTVLEGDILYSVGVRIVIATHILKDTKRAALSGHLSSVRSALTVAALDAELPDNIGAKGIMFLPEEPEADEEEQREILTAEIAFVAIEAT